VVIVTLQDKVLAALSDELRKRKYQGNPNRITGHCYVASEALYHLLGGNRQGYAPHFVRHEGEPHWYLEAPGGKRIDLTASQFTTPVPYDLGRGKGFLTRQPSKRAQIVIDRVLDKMPDPSRKVGP